MPNKEINFNSKPNKIVFTTKDNLIYEVWNNRKKVGEVTSGQNLEFKNLTPGQYTFEVYLFNGRRRRKLRSSYKSRSSVSSVSIINIVNQRMQLDRRR